MKYSFCDKMLVFVLNHRKLCHWLMELAVMLLLKCVQCNLCCCIPVSWMYCFLWFHNVLTLTVEIANPQYIIYNCDVTDSLYICVWNDKVQYFTKSSIHPLTYQPVAIRPSIQAFKLSGILLVNILLIIKSHANFLGCYSSKDIDWCVFVAVWLAGCHGNDETTTICTPVKPCSNSANFGHYYSNLLINFSYLIMVFSQT